MILIPIKFILFIRKGSYSRTYGSGSALEAADDYDPTLSKYKDFLFAPDDLPVQVATPKVFLFFLKRKFSLLT